MPRCACAASSRLRRIANGCARASPPHRCHESPNASCRACARSSRSEGAKSHRIHACVGEGARPKRRDQQWEGALPVDLAPYRQHRRILTASLVGTAVEFYDFYIYGTAAALVFGPLFFLESSDSAQLMYSFMTFGLAFFARPIGAIVFGHYGDQIGRAHV